MIATYEPGLNGPLVAGVDVGGTKTSVVVIDDRDRILYEHVTPTDRSSLVGQITGLVDDAQRQLREDVAAVGVAIPATSTRRTARSAWPSTWASPTYRWDRCCRRSWGYRSSSSTMPARRRYG